MLRQLTLFFLFAASSYSTTALAQVLHWKIFLNELPQKGQSTAPATQQTSKTPDSTAYYQTLKIKEEIKELKRKNAVGPVARFMESFGPFVTALVAVLGVAFSIFKFTGEKRLESNQRERDKFDKLIANLYAEPRINQSAAAVSLLSFLEPEKKKFHRQAYLALLSRVKSLEDKDHVAKTIIKVFERALRLNIDEIRSAYSIDLGTSSESDYLLELDFSNAVLHRIDLSNLDLSGADFAFADLTQANLQNTTLYRAKGYQANFNRASFSKAKMNEGRFQEAKFAKVHFNEVEFKNSFFQKSILPEAKFQQAQLQGSHFEDANLKGAAFQQAMLTETFFKRAQGLQGDVLNTILRSKEQSWKKAHFDSDIREELEGSKGQ